MGTFATPVATSERMDSFARSVGRSTSDSLQCTTLCSWTGCRSTFVFSSHTIFKMPVLPPCISLSPLRFASEPLFTLSSPSLLKQSTQVQQRTISPGDLSTPLSNILLPSLSLLGWDSVTVCRSMPSSYFPSLFLPIVLLKFFFSSLSLRVPNHIQFCSVHCRCTLNHQSQRGFVLHSFFPVRSSFHSPFFDFPFVPPCLCDFVLVSPCLFRSVTPPELILTWLPSPLFSSSLFSPSGSFFLLVRFLSLLEGCVFQNVILCPAMDAPFLVGHACLPH